MRVTVLYGSETGNAEYLAEQAASRLTSEGFDALCLNMEGVKAEELPGYDYLLIITSTWGDGEPPTNAEPLWTELSKKPVIDLSGVRFAVLALGDTAYPEFCKCGRDFDEWLAELGAKRLLDRVDCDIDYEEPYEKWMGAVINVLKPQPVS